MRLTFKSNHPNNKFWSLLYKIVYFLLTNNDCCPDENVINFETWLNDIHTILYTSD